MKTVADKMGLKTDSRAIFINAPASAIKAIQPPKLRIAKQFRGGFDVIHFFVTRQDVLSRKFPSLKSHLNHGGAVWICWPKGGKENSDLNIKVVIRIGYDAGLVESKALSIDSTWSALKFTHPKEGKEYRNSYGTLSDSLKSK